MTVELPNLDNFSGEFIGRAEGSDFQLRVLRAGDILEATVDWHPEEEYKEDHCRLFGIVEPDRVIMRYWRNATHPNGADHGEALVYPTDDCDVFNGRWFSFLVEPQREDWTLRKTSECDSLVEGAFPPDASLPLSWVAMSVRKGERCR